MDIIEELFPEGTRAVGSRAVAQALDLSEAETRAWADELGVAKIGASWAWTQPDVEMLLAEIAPDGEDEDREEDDPEDEDPDEDDEEEQEEDDDAG
ncbi:MAG: hypothetical protein ACRENE_03705 [Polyangiaceae bacterium]